MPPRVRDALRIAAATFGLALLASHAGADDDALGSQEIAELAQMNRDVPDAVELLQFGERAMAEEDYAAAAVRFAEARSFAPEAALPARRHCQALIALEQRHDAVSACRTALERGATDEDQRLLSAAFRSGEPDASSSRTLALFAVIGLSLATLAAWRLALRLRRIRRVSRRLSRITV